MFDICLKFRPVKNQVFMQIVLLGYMGSGKSTIGKKLAASLQLDFIDLDQYIAQKEDCSITNIFSSKGEIYFRKLEQKALKEIMNSERNFVLAVGGGTPCYGNNIDLINASTSVYLKTSVKVLYDRLKRQKQKRPLIKNIRTEDLQEFIAKHLFERSSYYEKAKVIVHTEEKEVYQVVNEIRLNMQ